MSFASGRQFGELAAAIAGKLKDQADQQKIKAALDWRWYQPVTPELPVARSVVCGDLLTVGIPEGWRDLDDEELAQVSAKARARALFGVLCTEALDSRSGLSLTHFNLLEVGPVGPDGELLFAMIDRLVEERVQRLGASRQGVPWKIGLDGERAFVHHMAASEPGQTFGLDDPVAMMLAEVYVVHRETGYVGSFVSPVETYQSYLPQLWTMLGNWHWNWQGAAPDRRPGDLERGVTQQ